MSIESQMLRQRAHFLLMHIGDSEFYISAAERAEVERKAEEWLNQASRIEQEEGSWFNRGVQPDKET